MRNLQKILALVLAMIMSFSLVTTAGAFSDDADITESYTDAVTVLNGLDVFKGYDNGATFQPKGNITRAEVAAIIYRIVTGDTTDAQASIYSSYGQFNDVLDGSWYAGYVNYCANAGYIKGRGNKTFDPQGQVTGYEALAMILRAVGYDKNNEFTGTNWQVRTASIANERGITKNVTSTLLGQAATREVVAEILFQSTLARKVDFSANTLSYTQKGEKDTLGYESFKLERIQGVVTANEYADLYDTDVLAKDKTNLEVDGSVRTLDIGSELTDIGESRYAYIAGSKVLHLGDTGSNKVYDNAELETEKGKGVDISTDKKFEDVSGLKKDGTEFYVNFGDDEDWESDWRIRYEFTVRVNSTETDIEKAMAEIRTAASRRDLTVPDVPAKNFTSYRVGTSDVWSYGDDDKIGIEWKLTKTAAAWELNYSRAFKPDDKINTTHQDNIESIFDIADRLDKDTRDNYVTGEVYVGTTSTKDVSDEMSFSQFKKEYIKEDNYDRSWKESENGEWVKIVDNNGDGKAEYAFKTTYWMDEVLGSHTKSGETVYEYDYINVDNYDEVVYLDEVAVGDVVYYSIIDDKVLINKAESVDAKINSIAFRNETVTTTDGTTYGQSGIYNMTDMDDVITDMDENVDYQMYMDRFGYIRVYKLSSGTKYALVTELYRDGNYNSQYVRDLDYTAEIKAGTAPVKEYDLVNSNRNDFILPNDADWADWNRAPYNTIAKNENIVLDPAYDGALTHVARYALDGSDGVRLTTAEDSSRGVRYIKLDSTKVISADARRYSVDANYYNTNNNEIGSRDYVNATHETEFYIVSQNHRTLRYFKDYENVPKIENLTASYTVARNTNLDSDEAPYWVAEVVVFEVERDTENHYASISFVYSAERQTSNEVVYLNALDSKSGEVTINPVNETWNSWNKMGNGFYGLIDTKMNNGVMNVETIESNLVESDYNFYGIYAGEVQAVNRVVGKGNYLDICFRDDAGNIIAERELDRAPVYGVDVDTLVPLTPSNDYTQSDVKLGDRVIWVQTSTTMGDSVSFIVDVTPHTYRDGDDSRNYDTPSWLYNKYSNNIETGLWKDVYDATVAKVKPVTPPTPEDIVSTAKKHTDFVEQITANSSAEDKAQLETIRDWYDAHINDADLTTAEKAALDVLKAAIDAAYERLGGEESYTVTAVFAGVEGLEPLQPAQTGTTAETKGKATFDLTETLARLDGEYTVEVSTTSEGVTAEYDAVAKTVTVTGVTANGTEITITLKKNNVGPADTLEVISGAAKTPEGMKAGDLVTISVAPAEGEKYDANLWYAVSGGSLTGFNAAQAKADGSLTFPYTLSERDITNGVTITVEKRNFMRNPVTGKPCVLGPVGDGLGLVDYNDLNEEVVSTRARMAVTDDVTLGEEGSLLKWKIGEEVVYFVFQNGNFILEKMSGDEIDTVLAAWDSLVPGEDGFVAAPITPEVTTITGIGEDGKTAVDPENNEIVLDLGQPKAIGARLPETITVDGTVELEVTWYLNGVKVTPAEGEEGIFAEAKTGYTYDVQIKTVENPENTLTGDITIKKDGAAEPIGTIKAEELTTGVDVINNEIIPSDAKRWTVEVKDEKGTVLTTLENVLPEKQVSYAYTGTLAENQSLEVSADNGFTAVVGEDGKTITITAPADELTEDKTATVTISVKEKPILKVEPITGRTELIAGSTVLATNIQDNIGFTFDAKTNTFKATGTLYYTKDWTDYTSNRDEDSGYFIALKLTHPSTDSSMIQVKRGTPPFTGALTSKYLDDDGILVYKVAVKDNKADSFTAHVVIDKNTVEDYTIDLSGLNLKSNDADEGTLTVKAVDPQGRDYLVWGVDVAKLQNGVDVASVEGSTINLKGTAKYFKNETEETNGHWTMSSGKPWGSDDKDNQGYFLALDLSYPNAKPADFKIYLTNNNGTPKPGSNPADTKELNGDGILIWKIKSSTSFKPINNIKVEVAGKTFIINISDIVLRGTDVQIDGISDDGINLLGKKSSDLQSGIDVKDPVGNTIKITGDSKWINNWEKFDSNENGKYGNFVALNIEWPGVQYEDVSYGWGTSNPTGEKHLKEDGILILRLQNGKDEGYKLTIRAGGIQYVLDLSGITREPNPDDALRISLPQGKNADRYQDNRIDMTQGKLTGTLKFVWPGDTNKITQTAATSEEEKHGFYVALHAEVGGEPQEKLWWRVSGDTSEGEPCGAVVVAGEKANETGTTTSGNFIIPVKVGNDMFKSGERYEKIEIAAAKETDTVAEGSENRTSAEPDWDSSYTIDVSSLILGEKVSVSAMAGDEEYKINDIGGKVSVYQDNLKVSEPDKDNKITVLEGTLNWCDPNQIYGNSEDSGYYACLRFNMRVDETNTVNSLVHGLNGTTTGPTGAAQKIPYKVVKINDGELLLMLRVAASENDQASLAEKSTDLWIDGVQYVIDWSGVTLGPEPQDKTRDTIEQDNNAPVEENH